MDEIWWDTLLFLVCAILACIFAPLFYLLARIFNWLIKYFTTNIKDLPRLNGFFPILELYRGNFDGIDKGCKIGSSNRIFPLVNAGPHLDAQPTILVNDAKEMEKISSETEFPRLRPISQSIELLLGPSILSTFGREYQILQKAIAPIFSAESLNVFCNKTTHILETWMKTGILTSGVRTGGLYINEEIRNVVMGIVWNLCFTEEIDAKQIKEIRSCFDVGPEIKSDVANRLIFGNYFHAFFPVYHKLVKKGEILKKAVEDIIQRRAVNLKEKTANHNNNHNNNNNNNNDDKNNNYYTSQEDLNQIIKEINEEHSNSEINNKDNEDKQEIVDSDSDDINLCSNNNSNMNVLRNRFLNKSLANSNGSKCDKNNENENGIDDILSRLQNTAHSYYTNEPTNDNNSNNNTDNGDNLLDKNNQKLTKSQTIHNCLAIIFSSYNTISLLVCWTLYYLSKYPDIQASLRAEFDSIMGSRHFITLDDIKQMNFTRCVLYETIRMNPPQPMLAKESLRPVSIDNNTFPSGTIFYQVFYNAGRDPKYWDEPEQFRPARFDKKIKADPRRHTNSFCGFGSSGHICPAQDLAIVIGTIVIGAIVSSHRILHPKDCNPTIQYTGFLEPKNLKLNFMRRLDSRIF